MLAVLGEVQVLREQGWDQTEEPRAGQTLNAARLSPRGPGQDWMRRYPMIFARVAASPSGFGAIEPIRGNR